MLTTHENKEQINDLLLNSYIVITNSHNMYLMFIMKNILMNLNNRQ